MIKILGFLLQSLFMFLLTLSEDGTIIIGCTVLSIGLGGMAWASFGVNHLDIGAGVIINFQKYPKD